MILGAIVGSTAVGKSHFAIALAKELGCEIISADSRQVYRGFRIGTGQVESQEMAGVKHHLLDFLPADKQYNAKKFVDDVQTILSDNPNKRFLIVGGTGLYVKSLIEGVSEAPPSSEAIRSRLSREAEKVGLKKLHGRLQDIDMQSYTTYHPNDQLRIIRALEVFELTGQPFSSFKDKKEGGIGAVPVVWLSMDRDLLYRRINSRVDEMLENGWVYEVKSLFEHYGTADLPGFKSIGYHQLVSIDEDGVTRSIVDEIKKETRNYAKRQLTFFRNQFETEILDPFVENSQKRALSLFQK